jgi:leucine-rich PPR motif-containing protein
MLPRRVLRSQKNLCFPSRQYSTSTCVVQTTAQSISFPSHPTPAQSFQRHDHKPTSTQAKTKSTFQQHVPLNILEKSLKEVRNVINAMKAQGLRPDLTVYTTLLRLHIGQGDAEGARQLLHEMRANGVQPDVITYNIIIQHLVFKRSRSAIWQVIDDLSFHNLTPSPSVFDDLLHLANTPAHVRNVMKGMVKYNIKPDLIVFTRLMKMFVKRGDIDAAVATMTEMKQAGIAPDVVVFNNLLEGYAKVGDLAGVSRTLGQMADANISRDTVTYVRLIESAAQRRKYQDVHQLLLEMKASNLPLPTQQAINLVFLFVDSNDEFGIQQIIRSIYEVGYTLDIPCFTRVLGNRLSNFRATNVIAATLIWCGVPVTVDIFNMRLHTYAKDENKKGCAAVIQEMLSERIHPNLETTKVLSDLFPWKDPKGRAAKFLLACGVDSLVLEQLSAV